MLTKKQKALIGMLASIKISETTAALAASDLNESQMDELVDYLIKKHQTGTEATEEEVIKALLIFHRKSGKI